MLTGKLELHKREYGAALNALTDALCVAPSPLATRLLSSLFHLLGDHETPQKMLTNDEVGWHHRALTFLSRAQITESRACLDLAPHGTLEGVVDLLLNRPDRALNGFMKDQCWRFVAVCLARMGEFELAVQAARKAQTTDATDPVPAIVLSILLNDSSHAKSVDVKRVRKEWKEIWDRAQ